jgi:hypothetical protein
MGFKLEAPLHPLIFASTLPGWGGPAALLRQFPHTQVLLALLRGFHEQSPGGRVSCAATARPVLDYPLTDYVMDGARRALLAMAELSSPPAPARCCRCTSWPGSLHWAQAKAAIATADEAAADRGGQRPCDGRLRHGR